MTVKEYLEGLPQDRVEPFLRLRKTILDNLPEGFEETINYGMIGYVVPHSIYPAGYHCDPSQPLPFMALASQKGGIHFYHMGLYARKDWHDWFLDAYAKAARHKVDLGKSCVRFRHFDDIPFDLIGQLVRKVSVTDWVGLYEAELRGKPRGKHKGKA